MDENTNLSIKYIEYMEMPEEKRGTTFNDFFDWIGVPMEQRNNFVVAAILKNAREIILNS